MPALAAAMLSACLGSARTDAPVHPDPIIETVHEVETVCPADLSVPVQPRPTPGGDAVIEYNGPGAAFIAALVAWGGAGWQVVTDAQAECPPSSASGAAE